MGPATPRARLHLSTPLRSSSLCQFALSSANTSSSRSACSAACHRRRSRSGRASSPELAPSRPEHRLLLARLVLASVSHGKLPFPGNPSSESWPSSPEHSAPWTSPLRNPSLSFHAHEHRPSSVKLSRHFSRPLSARDGRPMVSHTTAPPWPLASSLSSSSGPATCATVSALARWSRGW